MSRRHLITRFLDLFKSFNQHYLDKSFPFKRINPSQRNKWRHVNVSVVLRPFRFVDCSFCRVIQVAKTKKWIFILAFVRLVAFHKAPKRTNEMAVSGFHTKRMSWAYYIINNYLLIVWWLIRVGGAKFIVHSIYSWLVYETRLLTLC